MGAVPRARARRRGPRRRPRPRRRGPPGGGARSLSPLLIREGPATELTVATRILAHRGLLASGGRVAMLVGSEVVYVGGRTASPTTMTPYDVAAVRLGDGLLLAGSPPDDVERYLAALRADPGARVVAAVSSGESVAAADVVDLIERTAAVPWAVAEGEARAAGALLGAYAAES